MSSIRLNLARSSGTMPLPDETTPAKLSCTDIQHWITSRIGSWRRRRRRNRLIGWSMLVGYASANCFHPGMLAVRCQSAVAAGRPWSWQPGEVFPEQLAPCLAQARPTGLAEENAAVDRCLSAGTCVWPRSGGWGS